MAQAASAAILKDKKILLIKRSAYTNAFPGHWAFPGGRVDEGETVEEGVIREVQEEINLQFKPTRLLAHKKWEDREIYRYLGEWSGEPKPQAEEVDDWGWFTYEETKKLPMAFDYTERIEQLHQEGLL